MSESKEYIKWAGFGKVGEISRAINELSFKNRSLEIMAIDRWGIRVYVAGQVNKLKRNGR